MYPGIPIRIEYPVRESQSISLSVLMRRLFYLSLTISCGVCVHAQGIIGYSPHPPRWTYVSEVQRIGYTLMPLLEVSLLVSIGELGSTVA